MPAAAALPESVRRDPFVLHGRQLVDGVTLAETSRFSDDVWPLGPAVMQRSGRSLSLHFDKFPDEHRTDMKLLCYAALSGPLPDEEDRPSISTVVMMTNRIRYLCNWMSAYRPGLAISDLKRDDLDDFQTHLATHVPSAWQRYALRTVVAFLWRYRTTLGSRALRFDPRLTEFWVAEPYPGKRTENATSRIPEAVHGPLLVWSMRFVDDFSDDIIHGVELWRLRKRRQRVGSGSENRPGLRWGEAPGLIRAYIERVRAAGRPIPGVDGRPNFEAISRAVGCSTLALTGFKDELWELARDLGVSEYADLDQTITGRLDGQPWITGFRTNPRDVDSLSTMALLLQTACYIVVAFLSGMRDNEIKHLRVGACEIVRDSQGSPMRWIAHSLAFKGENVAEGVNATWVIGEPASRAITVLERLAAASGSQTPWLFAPLRTGPGRGSGARNSNEVLTVSATILALNRFRNWITRYCDDRNRSDGVPDHNGRPWRLTTRQFRRTLAWYIARRPGGAIAGAIAYRHHSIQMFEGYAGTSDSGFRAEVEAEAALARGEYLLELVERNDHLHLGGPGAGEARARLAEFKANGVFAGTVQTDPRRFLRLLKSRGPEVYPGQYVTCTFDASKAQCHKTTSGPDLQSCQPTSCQNVALSADNMKTWQAELALIDADLVQLPALPPALVEQLKRRRTRVLALLNGESDVTPD